MSNRCLLMMSAFYVLSKKSLPTSRSCTYSPVFFQKTLKRYSSRLYSKVLYLHLISVYDVRLRLRYCCSLNMDSQLFYHHLWQKLFLTHYVCVWVSVCLCVHVCACACACVCVPLFKINWPCICGSISVLLFFFIDLFVYFINVLLDCGFIVQ